MYVFPWFYGHLCSWILMTPLVDMNSKTFIKCSVFSAMQGSSHQRSFYFKPTHCFKIADCHFGLFPVSVTKQNKSISTQEKYAMNSFTQRKPNWSFSFYFFPPGVTHHIECLEIPAKQGEWPSVFCMHWIPTQAWLGLCCPGARKSWHFPGTLHSAPYLKNLEIFFFWKGQLYVPFKSYTF